MTEESSPPKTPGETGLFSGWRFGNLFSRGISDDEKKAAVTSDALSELQGIYPDNAQEIIDFLAKILRRRQPIVEHLSKYPELNDHGFFMIICKMYRDTYHGIGQTNDRITHLIAMFSTTDISRATAARTLQKANEVNVFVTYRDKKDRRKQRYYLHAEMIQLCSDAFGGMIEDVLLSHAAREQVSQESS